MAFAYSTITTESLTNELAKNLNEVLGKRVPPTADVKTIPITPTYFGSVDVKKVTQKLVPNVPNSFRFQYPNNNYILMHGYSPAGVKKTGGGGKAPTYVLRVHHVFPKNDADSFAHGAFPLHTAMEKVDEFLRECIDFTLIKFGKGLPDWFTKGGRFNIKSGVESIFSTRNDEGDIVSSSNAFFLHPEYCQHKMYDNATRTLVDVRVDDYVYNETKGYGTGSGNSLFDLTLQVKMVDFVLNPETGLIDVTAYINVSKATMYDCGQNRTPLKDAHDFKVIKNKEEDDSLLRKLASNDQEMLDFYTDNNLTNGGSYSLAPIKTNKRKAISDANV